MIEEPEIIDSTNMEISASFQSSMMKKLHRRVRQILKNALSKRSTAGLSLPLIPKVWTKRLEMSPLNVENLIIQQAQTFILGGDSVFVIIGTAAIEDFNGIINAVREFTENFQLTND